MVLITSFLNSFIALGSAAAIKPFSSKVRLKPVLFTFALYYVLELFLLRTGYIGFLMKILVLLLFHRLVLLRSKQDSMVHTVLGLTVLASANIMTALSELMLNDKIIMTKIITGFDELGHIGFKFLYVIFFIVIVRFFMGKSCNVCTGLTRYPLRLLVLDASILLIFIYLINMTLRYVVGYYSVFSTLPKLNLIFYILVLAMIVGAYLVVFVVNSYWFRMQNFSIIKCQAELDPMTGVYNRRYGLQLLHATYCKAKAKNSNFVLCFFDINNLKLVNDRYGHPEGDKLILTIATKAGEALRENDFIIRYGGDEFIIVFANCSLKDAKGAWHRISNSFDAINMSEGNSYYISASAGFSSFEENKELGISELINLADNEMYKAKRSFKQYTQA